jgi:heptosyltransferase-2
VSTGKTALPLMQWAALARRVGRVVAPDTGVVHLASAAGVDVTVLFGPTDLRRHHPIGPGRVLVVDGGAGRKCAPCYGTSCVHGGTAACLDDVGLRVHRDVAWSP